MKIFNISTHTVHSTNKPRLTIKNKQSFVIPYEGPPIHDTFGMPDTSISTETLHTSRVVIDTILYTKN